MTTVQQIREVIVRGKAEGLDRVQSELNKVAAAQDNVAASSQAVATVTDMATRKQLSASVAFDRLRKSVDDEYRALKALEKAQRDADRAVAQGVATQEQAAAVVAAAAAKYRAAGTAATGMGKAAADGAGLAGHEIQNLTFQLNDAATMLATGSSPFQVIASQGGQVYQVLAGANGGVVGGVRSLGGTLAGLATPARLAGGALVALTVAAIAAYGSFADGQRQLSLATDGLGRSTGATVAQLESVAEAAARASHVSTGAARDLVAGFAATGKIGVDVYGDLIEASKRYSTLTGTDLADAGKQLTEAFAAPGRGARDLDAKLNFLNAETLKYIRNLDDTNQRGRAQKVMLDELNRNLPDAAQNVTLLGRAWRGVAGFADLAYTAMGKAVHAALFGDDLDARIATLEKLLALQKSGSYFGARSGLPQGNAADTEKELNRLYAERARLAQQTADAVARTAGKEADAASRDLNPQVQELERLIALQAKLRAGLNNPANNTDQYLMDLEGIRNQIAGIVGEDGKLLSVSEQLRRERELIIKVDTARNASERANAQAALDEFRAKKQGASDAAAAAQAEDGRLKAQAQTYAALAQAARERDFAARQAAAQRQLELDLIGKTADEQDRLRANFQAEWDLRREAEANGTGFDERQLTILKAQNEQLAAKGRLLAENKLKADIQFERDQLGRSEGDRQIASAQRSAGLPVDLKSANAEAMRLNQTLAQTQDIASSALSGFAQDLLNGTNAAQALNNMLKRIASQLIDMAAKQLVAQALGGLGGGGTGRVDISGGTSSIGLFHSGGLVGAEQPSSRIVSHAVFAGAPRFHSGGYLSPGEVPAILQKGEAVFTAGQMRALGQQIGAARQAVAAAGSGGGVSVQVVNQTGVPAGAQAEVTKGPNGQQLVRIVLGAVKKDYASGGFDQAQRGRYGVAPTLVRRG